MCVRRCVASISRICFEREGLELPLPSPPSVPIHIHADNESGITTWIWIRCEYHFYPKWHSEWVPCALWIFIDIPNNKEAKYYDMHTVILSY